METKTGGVQALNTRGPLPAAGQLPTARRSRRATGRVRGLSFCSMPGVFCRTGDSVVGKTTRCTKNQPFAQRTDTPLRTQAAAPQQQQQQYQQQLRVCSSKAINARGPVASPRAVVPGSVVEPAVEVVQGSADAGAAQQQAPAMNQVADLETILQERDACGVGFVFPARTDG
eukprot:1153050-Pelagomonas_calceolata.AAC.18